MPFGVYYKTPSTLPKSLLIWKTWANEIILKPLYKKNRLASRWGLI